MSELASAIDDVARATGFSGVVAVDRAGGVTFERAYGLADRAHRIPVTVDTRFGIASGTKGFTALTIESLIADGVLSRATTARSVLGADLPLIGADVTIEHLLTHTSGIGDYVDEDDDDESDGAAADSAVDSAVDSVADDEAYVLRVPVHTLDTTPGYLAALDGFPTKFPAGTRFSYCNSGYVVLALIAERVSGRSFPGLLGERVFAPAGMHSTAFLRMDALPGDAAIGYLNDGRTNVLHLPVRGSGDGGAFSTVADLRVFWPALFAGRIVAADRVADLVSPRAGSGAGTKRYGAGFWLDPGRGAVLLEGGDVGVSFYSAHEPTTGRTCTVLSNTAAGAGQVWSRLDELLGPSR